MCGASSLELQPLDPHPSYSDASRMGSAVQVVYRVFVVRLSQLRIIGLLRPHHNIYLTSRFLSHLCQVFSSSPPYLCFSNLQHCLLRWGSPADEFVTRPHFLFLYLFSAAVGKILISWWEIINFQDIYLLESLCYTKDRK